MPKSTRKKISRHNNYSPEHDKLNWEWYNPNESNIAVSFCKETSLHGIKYLGQQKRHVFERIVWLAAFVASVVTAVVLIWGMWSEYTNMPIITVFNPIETKLDEIPFPGVTICNVNSLQKSTFNKQLQKVTSNGVIEGMKRLSDPEAQLSNITLMGLARMLDMGHVCDSVLTFVDRLIGNSSVLLSYEAIRDAINLYTQEVEEYIDPIYTLQEVSQPCKEMILHCVWLEDVTNCDELFQDIETDYGHCCTFNTLPVPLLLNGLDVDDPEAEYNSGVFKDWKDANLNYENVMFTENTENRTYPYRQKYPGRTAGLSFLLDPDLDEYFCTNTDSEGFILGINVPLDFPRMKDNGIAIQTNSEIFVGMTPEVTMSHDSIKTFPVEKRQCYYGNEYELPHYTKYTVSNCMNECIARKTLEKYDETDPLCKPSMYTCTNDVRKDIVRHGLSKSCSECLPTCTEIKYQKEITLQTLQKKKIDELFQAFPSKSGTKSYYDRNVSIVHVYFDTDSVHPKLRKEMTTMTELISNAGGILGLCCGFSFLSFLEILYYGSLRPCCSFYRDKIIRDHNKRLEEGNQIEKQHGSSNVAIHPKKGRLPKLLNVTSDFNNMDKNTNSKNNKLKKVREEDANDDDDDNQFVRQEVFKPGRRIVNQPLHYFGFGEEQFQRDFLASAYPETAFPTYAK